jgi:hypothetical protein
MSSDSDDYAQQEENELCRYGTALPEYEAGKYVVFFYCESAK